MEDTSNEDDPNTSPQLKETFLFKFEYIFHLDSTYKKLITQSLVHKQTPKHTNHFSMNLTFSHSQFTSLHPRKATFTVYMRSR